MSEGSTLSEDPPGFELIKPSRVLEDDIYATIVTLVFCCTCIIPFSYYQDGGVKALEKLNKDKYKYTKIDQIIYNLSWSSLLFSFFGLVSKSNNCRLNNLFVFICNIIVVIIMWNIQYAKGGFRLFLRILSGILSFGTSLFQGTPLGDFRHFSFKEFYKRRTNVSWDVDC